MYILHIKCIVRKVSSYLCQFYINIQDFITLRLIFIIKVPLINQTLFVVMSNCLYDVLRFHVYRKCSMSLCIQQLIHSGISR